MEDIISLLPDSLLVEFISRLDTREAIRTSILSKRWKHLWTRVPNLNLVLTCIYQHRFPEFISFIEKVACQRGQSRLNKLILSMPYHISNESTVSKLIHYAVTCNVQDLDLGFEDTKSPKYVLDQFFFINSSFTHLKLWNCLFNNATGVISWSNLKLLSIREVQLDDNLVKNILSGSPLLETLHLLWCHGFGRIDITSPCLKNLVVGGYGQHGYIADILEINAPHILSLEIEDELIVSKVVLLNVSSLVEARLDYWIGSSSREVKEEMLKGQIVSLRRVEKLEIGFYILKLLARLEAKGFNFPSDMKFPELFTNYSSDCYNSDTDLSTDSDWSDNDSIESEDE